MSKEDEKACDNPLLVMVDEASGSKFARATGMKGIGDRGEMDWLIKDISETWNSWGHIGGPEQELIVKSDGEAAITALREAAMKFHGGKAIPENPGMGEKAENGVHF